MSKTTIAMAILLGLLVCTSIFTAYQAGRLAMQREQQMQRQPREIPVGMHVHSEDFLEPVTVMIWRSPRANYNDPVDRMYTGVRSIQMLHEGSSSK